MTLSNRIPEFLTQNDNSGKLKFGHSLCESDECPNLDGSDGQPIRQETIVDDISTASCSKD